MAERLLLVGMMGAGKTTVARLAARRLRWAYVDTDGEITRSTGATVPELFARHGEGRFREEEARALDAVLGRPGPLVVSVGGGAVLDPANRRRLREAGTVVWLRARPATLLARVHDGAGRPLLAGDSPEDRALTLERLEAERRPLYAEVAHEVVDVDHLDAERVTDRLLVCTGLDAPRPGART